MILIADSGSTKTDWAAVADGMLQHRIQTEGINPFVQTDDEMSSILSSLISQLGDDGVSRASVFFYGAGVRGEMAERMQGLLGRFFSSDVAVASDLLGAARALFGKCEGIACILGTGSNSGLYDGCRIVENTPPLGYILGDEGSGAVLGRLFINALFKHRLPGSLREEFLSDTGQDMEDIIYNVYKQPLANRYLATACKFIRRHLDCGELRALVVENFRDFFRKNLVAYQRPDLAVSAVGSVAYFFEAEFREAARCEGYAVGTVVQSPMEGLITFHTGISS